MSLLTDKELNELIYKFRAGDIEARNIIVEKNARLVSSIARRYLGNGSLEYDDLFQEGNIGLIKAIDKFNPEKGFRFSTYATWWVRQSMRRALSDNLRTIRVPIHVQENISRIKKAQKNLEQELGRAATIDEVMESININCLSYKDIINHEYFQTLVDVINSGQDDSEITEIEIIISEELDYVDDTELVLKEIVSHVKKNGTVPTIKTIQNKINLSKAKVEEYLRHDCNISSIDVPANDEMDSSFGDNIASNEESIEDNYQKKVMVEGLERAIDECFSLKEDRTVKMVQALKDSINYLENLNKEKLEISFEFIEKINDSICDMNDFSKKELCKILIKEAGLKKKDIYTKKEIDTKETIKNLTNTLKNKKVNNINHAEIIKRRFGVCGYNKSTLDEIGTIFNVSRERIRQIEKKILLDENFKEKVAIYCNISPDDFV